MINFKWRHFQKDIILLVVRWYLAYALSYRDIEEMMQERGISVDHSTIQRWAVHYAPKLEEQFRQKHKKSVGSSWRVDETYVKIKGVWHYLYRAVDKAGDTLDFRLSEKRDTAAARAFFEKAIRCHGLPDKVTIDKSGANKAGIESINCQLMLLTIIGYLASGQMTHWPFQIQVRQIKYLNNVVEQTGLRKGQHQQAANMTLFEQFYVLAA
jgi:putative transposase